jgi:hypothetical protein
MDIMDPKWKYGLWGIVLGAVLCAVVGFKWGGWETRGSAQILAQERANAALVKALTPICVAKFQGASNAPVKLDELKKIRSAWARESFVREGKWADIGNELNRPVVDACADALYKL